MDRYPVYSNRMAAASNKNVISLPPAEGCHGKSEGQPEDLPWHPKAGGRGNILS